MLKSVLPLSFIVASRFFGLFIILPVLSLYALELQGANAFLIGLLVGSYALAQMIFQVPFGILSDKIGRKKTMLFGLLIFIIGSFICALANDIYTMLFGRLLQGSGAIGAVATALIADFIPEEKRSKAMAIMGVFIGLSFALSMLISPLLSAAFGLSSLFYLSIILTLFCIFLLFFAVPKEPKLTHHSPKTPFKVLLGEKNLILMNITNFMQKMLLSISFIIIPIILVEKVFTMPKESLFIVYASAMLIGFLAMGLAGVLGEKKGKAKAILLLGVACFSLAYLIFAFVPALIFLAHGEFFFIIGVVIFFLGFNLHEPIMQSCASKFAKANQRGAALGVFNAFGYAGSFVGGIFGGFILSHDFGGALGYALLAFLFLVLLNIAWFIGLCFLKNPSDFKNLYLAKQSDTNKLLNIKGVVEIYENTKAKIVKYDSKILKEEELQKLI